MLTKTKCWALKRVNDLYSYIWKYGYTTKQFGSRTFVSIIGYIPWWILSDAPGASFAEVINRRADIDMHVKMREDPLYAIR